MRGVLKKGMLRNEWGLVRRCRIRVVDCGGVLRDVGVDRGVGLGSGWSRVRD